MSSTWDILATILAAALLVPFAVLTVEALAALLPSRKLSRTVTLRPRIAVLVPAHNEEADIAMTLTRIREQLQPGDRLLVVADNCTDRTAEVARAAGADALERTDAIRRGKGYALDFGLKQLAADPPAVVVFIDADTEVLPGAIEALANAVIASNRPVQGLNLLDAPADSGPAARIGAFAFFFKNAIRPRGLSWLGVPCLLYGTGMALPWSIISHINLAHGDITEDIRLGIELARIGYPARFCPEAQVHGLLPRQDAALTGQRQRWEHGHLRTITREVPGLIAAALFRGRPSLLFLALHVGVPPLAFLFLITTMCMLGLAAFGKYGPAVALAIGMAIALGSIQLTWVRFGRARLPASDLLLLPFYAAMKIPLYFRFFVRPQRDWVRTERDNSAR